MSDTKDLRVGDIVRHTRTMEVTFAKDGYVELHDTANPITRLGLWPTHKGSDEIAVVKKAKPQVGDVVTANTIRATQWKRGTLIQVTFGGGVGATYMLTGDGDWVSAGGSVRVKFSDFRGGFKVLHVA